MIRSKQLQLLDDRDRIIVEQQEKIECLEIKIQAIESERDFLKEVNKSYLESLMGGSERNGESDK